MIGQIPEIPQSTALGEGYTFYKDELNRRDQLMSTMRTEHQAQLHVLRANRDSLQELAQNQMYMFSFFIILTMGIATYTILFVTSKYRRMAMKQCRNCPLYQAQGKEYFQNSPMAAVKENALKGRINTINNSFITNSFISDDLNKHPLYRSMKNTFVFALLLTALLSCKKDDQVSATRCYKDQSFNTTKSFNCYTQEQVKIIADQKLRGQTTMNLVVATDADKSANPDACQSCR